VPRVRLVLMRYSMRGGAMNAQNSNDGRRLIMNYEKDGFCDYLKHLLHSPICREYVGLSYGTVLVWFSRLVEARQHFIQYVFTNPQR
jgi:hypothetical protein